MKTEQIQKTKDFGYIKEALIKKFEDRYKETCESIGQVNEHHKTPEDSLRWFTRWKLNKRSDYYGTFEEQKQKALKQFKKRLNKKLKDTLEHLNQILTHDGTLHEFYITVEWQRGSMGAMQAKAHDSDGNESERTGGYGYCKESTATAQILNQHFEILKKLCSLKNMQIEKTNREALGYGSGYGIIPRFEGGVGVSTHRQILNNIGLEMEKVSWTDKTDVYRVYVKDDEV